MTTFLFCLALFVFVVWVPNTLEMLLGMSLVPRLRSVTPLENSLCPKISVIVPACNEAETVEPAMRSLLGMDYPDYEIIAIDDRSTDETGKILDRLGAVDPRLRVVHIGTLPAGWLGKNNALQQGSDMARGEWLLFTDADVVYKPDALRRCMAVALKSKCDHLVALPQVILTGFWESILVSFFGVMFNFRFRPWQASWKWGSGYVGVGAFNMVRAESYRKLGGHAPLRMEVVDDVKLGKILKHAGFRQFVAIADDFIRVRWVIGLKGIVHGLAKNSFAALNYSWPRVFVSCVFVLAASIWPFVGIFLGTPLDRVFCLAAICAMLLAGIMLGESTRVPAPYVLAWPLAGILFVFVIVRSGVLTQRQRGIYWRGTFYSLDELRRNMA